MAKRNNEALRNMKMEVAKELGYDYNSDKGEMTARQHGKVGGLMVKKLIQRSIDSL